MEPLPLQRTEERRSQRKRVEAEGKSCYTITLASYCLTILHSFRGSFSHLLEQVQLVLFILQRREESLRHFLILTLTGKSKSRGVRMSAGTGMGTEGRANCQC
ncbi:hypothetical protein I7I50_10606 [Histoplasma capsulatum G186AR]|uniref:Uncharacterized protein n=1 Tax=Ajellomyces capsulatus TaxID=5037 RepID=A0A8H7Z405_AJECA|nr:hypothetical protein I7I52_01844 [Histoplasma capsulatum]QSS69341.1 hypothetical protein I7I50_10606 [Histoplasma capsulatum G186AR]